MAGVPKWNEAERADLVERVLDEIASGRSLKSIAEDEGMPDERTLRRWLMDPATAPQYAQARETRADVRAAEIEEVAAEVRAGKLAPDAGRVVIDALKWSASKLHPKTYGDRMQHDHNVSVHAAQVEALRTFTAPALAAPDVIEGTFVDVTEEEPRAKDADADLDDMLS